MLMSVKLRLPVLANNNAASHLIRAMNITELRRIIRCLGGSDGDRSMIFMLFRKRYNESAQRNSFFVEYLPLLHLLTDNDCNEGAGVKLLWKATSILEQYLY